MALTQIVHTVNFTLYRLHHPKLTRPIHFVRNSDELIFGPAAQLRSGAFRGHHAPRDDIREQQPSLTLVALV